MAAQENIWLAAMSAMRSIYHECKPNIYLRPNLTEVIFYLITFLELDLIGEM